MNRRRIPRQPVPCPAGETRATSGRVQPDAAARTGPSHLRLQPADSFDLIRLLARSQSDPRKAVAELVQNSLDAGARRIDLTWLRRKGRRILELTDDGEGIFPEVSRQEALRRIATTIGHSHKRELTPAQRRELMALGKYGIGLLGFWALGRQMTIMSRVGGGAAWALTLFEDSADAQLERARQRLDDPATLTHITIHDVHEGAARQIRPGRLHAYLAGELRGQLLERGTEIRIHDRVARGTAVKEFVVTAQRFPGRPLPQLRTLKVAGHEDARVELYLVAREEERTGRVQLACGGTTVLDDLAVVDGAGEPRAPWAAGRLEGVIDFPELEVPPGTRRGFRRDAAALAFLDALAGLEAQLAAVLAEDDERRARQRDANLARELRRVFRPVARVLREYAWFDLERGGRAGRGPRTGGAPLAGADGAALPRAEPASDEAEGGASDDADDGVEAEPRLFPPGPLDSVRVRPASSRLPPGARRNLRARALDTERRPLAGGVSFAWRLEGPGGLAADAGRATFTAPPSPATSTIHVVAVQGGVERAGSSTIETDDELTGADPSEGIPEPVPVAAPREPWRSRMTEGRWEFNTGHRDHELAARDEARRLRYLAALLVKEVVLRNFGKPGDGPVLERMVELLTHLDDARRPDRTGRRNVRRTSRSVP